MANEQETSDEEMDALDAALSEAAREKIRKAEEEAGIAGDGPGSVADFAEMAPMSWSRCLEKPRVSR